MAKSADSPPVNQQKIYANISRFLAQYSESSEDFVPDISDID